MAVERIRTIGPLGNILLAVIDRAAVVAPLEARAFREGISLLPGFHVEDVDREEFLTGRIQFVGEVAVVWAGNPITDPEILPSNGVEVEENLLRCLHIPLFAAED